MATASPRTMDSFLDFVKGYEDPSNSSNTITWGSDADINTLLQQIKDKGDVTSADLTQMIALTGKANIQSQFVSSLIQEYTGLMKALLQKMS